MIADPGFIHLHAHTAFSLREGALTLGRLIALAEKDAQPALAVTDTNNLFAALLFSIVIVAIHGDGAEEWARANANIIGVIEFVPIIAYYAYFSAGPWQATPGKRICGIYVIRTNGARLDAPFGALRYLTYFLSALPLGLGFLMPLWTKERKALHDIICGTRVVYGRL